MKDKLDTLLVERINRYSKRLENAFLKDFSKARDKKFAYQYYLNLKELHLTGFLNAFPKSRYVYNTIDRYYKLGQPVKNALEEIKQKLKYMELTEVRVFNASGAMQVDETELVYDLESRKDMAEFYDTYLEENFHPIIVDDMEVYEELSQVEEELKLVIGEEEDIKSMAVPKSVLDRKTIRQFKKQMRELKYQMTSFLYFEDEDFVYFYADKKAKECFFTDVQDHYKAYINDVKENEAENNLKEGVGNEYTNYQRTAALYLLLEKLGIDEKNGFTQKSVSRFLEFFTGVKESNLYEKVNEIYKHGYKSSHFDDLRVIRKFFVDLQAPEIVEKIDNITGDK